jgi:PAS domain S-box-containing protein
MPTSSTDPLDPDRLPCDLGGDSLAPADDADRDRLEELVAERTAALQQANDRLTREIADRQRAELELRESEEKYRLLYESSPDAIMTLAPPTWRFISGNPATVKMFGAKDEEEFTCHEPWKFSPERQPDGRASAEKAIEMIETAMLEGSHFFEWTHRRINGEVFPATVLLSRIMLAGKAFLQATVRDVTEQKRAEEKLRESEERFRATFDQAAVGIAHVGLQGRWLRVNHKLCEIVGYTREELAARTFQDITHPDDLEADLASLRQLLAGHISTYSMEKRYFHKDGSIVWIELTVSLVREPSGEPKYFISVVEDVCAKKRAEVELRQAKDAAEAASRAKSAFLAAMSHEIRTPMNGIMGMTELALESGLTGRQREYLELVKKSADALLAVVNEILDFSKIEAGKLDLDHAPFSLRQVLGDLLTVLAVRAHRQELELAYHIAPEVPDALIGDSGRLRQVLVNLVGNAIKFTERGEVVVSVEYADSENDKVTRWQGDKVTKTEDPQPGASAAASSVTLSPCHLVTLSFKVRDTGIGIPADKLPFLFQPFVQVDGSLTRQYEGTGLGLAISSRLVEMMGGKITVDTEVGKGSTFAFTVSLEVPSGPNELSVPAELAQFPGLRVLVVDDNTTNCRTLEEMLATWGLQPTAVESGGAALAALEDAHQAGRPFRLALLDTHMPEMDGFTLAEAIHQHPDWNEALILMVPSAGPAGSTARARAASLADLLIKPVKQADLLQVILRALGVAAPAGPPVAAERPTEPLGRPLRILLAEDNPVNQKVMVNLLEKEGHAVTVAGNGREALAALYPSDSPPAIGGSRRFDVVLMDVQMPELDGLRVTQAIRERERAAGDHLPVIALTAYALKGDRERCLEAGMDSYISKPIRPTELREALRAVVPARVGLPASSGGEVASPALLDVNSALAQVMGDRQLLAELAGLFQTEYPRWLTEMRAAVAGSDPARLQMAAHALKGAAATLAAWSTQEAALRLEMMGRAGDLSSAPDALAALAQEFERLRPALTVLEGS